ncbi:AMP-binding protein [Rhodococcus erythropolis]|uniref:AMP-binding protein n=1 Tax=Rhodococcus erythropolis TaxID=1833 RepID=A0A8I0ZY46_RHOER|nr:AMP-binding protein [Rhodococcus erythropolis]MBH5143531.1 AMP-binding protein [Rhodococcus erythropolis]
MYPPSIARDRPDALAYVMASSGRSLTYDQLDRRSNQLAHRWRQEGIRSGDTVVIAMENNIEWPVVVAAGMRSGLYVTPVNWHLKSDELASLIAESKPAVVVTSSALAATVSAALDAATHRAHRLSVDEHTDGFHHLGAEVAGLPETPIEDELLGARVLFSGGTTGRPKVFRQALLGIHPQDAPQRHGGLVEKLAIDSSAVMLSPAPNYHAAPFTFQLITLAAGGTIVCMEKFDADAALDAVRKYDVTHSQWVPTMLVRLLQTCGKERFSAPSHRVAVTSGAPCSADIKAEIDQWWGPILHEYYGASEGYGHTYISPLEARSHPGSVGRPLGSTSVHITDPDGVELGPKEIGTVWFAPNATQSYTNASDASDVSDASARKQMGDIGYLDDDGFLYLVGRAGFMIISGGVNIYPDEIEATLIAHPDVLDAAVIGVPHPEFGEQVKAIVELRAPAGSDAVVEADLIDYCRSKLAHYKAPKIVEFTERLPRLPTGKLDKRTLRDTFTRVDTLSIDIGGQP